MGPAPARNDDGVRLVQQFEPAIRNDLEAADGPQGTRLDGADREAIPIRTHLGTGQAEDFDGDAEFERAQTVIGEGDDEAVWHDIYVCRQKRHFPP